MRTSRVLLFLLVSGVLPGCSGCPFFAPGAAPDAGPFVGQDAGAFGAMCGPNIVPCRTGLVCTAAGTCGGAGTGAAGSVCVLTADCGPNLYCGPSRTCTAAAPGGPVSGGDGGLVVGMDGSATGGDGGSGGSTGVPGSSGARCASTADCIAGLVCSIEGFTAVCRAAGSGDLGAACTAELDCLAGLSCINGPRGSACASPPPLVAPDGGTLPPNLPFWPGETCMDDTMASPVAYFRVPRAGRNEGDFYRLPFPNDVRRSASGNLSMTGHATPGTALSVNIVDRYLRASEQDLRGFSTNPTIFFRFSRPYDWDTINGDRVLLVDLTTGPDFGQAVGRAWITTFGNLSKYICSDWLGVRPGHGAPLRPGHTYGAILLSGINDNTMARTPFAQDADFAQLLAATSPLDADLAAAWTAYAPLRAWLTSTMRAPSTVLNAAVFTTQDTEAVMRATAAVVAARPAPAVTGLTSCDTGPSPCADGTPARACSSRDDRFVELHGRITLPIFQQGTAPYERPEDGGAFLLDAMGAPQVARTEDVCVAITVPREAPPAGGFPVVVFAHGTGGSFTDAIRNGIAGDLASGADGSPKTALIGFDLPQHGARRGGSTRPPDELFFNFLNPRAARDNVLQGSADLLSVLRFAATYSQPMAGSPSGQELRFDPTKIGLFAHSQGATHAGLAVPYATGLRVVVLSGEGGDLGLSLLTKRKPIDIAGVLPFAILDFDGNGQLAAGEWHPLLGIFQQYFDSVDPVNYAWRLHSTPVDPSRSTNVFMTYGMGDSYTTPATMNAYTAAADLTHVRPVIESIGRNEVDAPLMGNIPAPMGMTEARTQGFRQYAPAAMSDGHFVAFDVPTARADVLRFLRRALGGNVPAIGL